MFSWRLNDCEQHGYFCSGSACRRDVLHLPGGLAEDFPTESHLCHALRRLRNGHVDRNQQNLRLSTSRSAWHTLKLLHRKQMITTCFQLLYKKKDTHTHWIQHFHCTSFNPSLYLNDIFLCLSVHLSKIPPTVHLPIPRSSSTNSSLSSRSEAERNCHERSPWRREAEGGDPLRESRTDDAGDDGHSQRLLWAVHGEPGRHSSGRAVLVARHGNTVTYDPKTICRIELWT